MLMATDADSHVPNNELTMRTDITFVIKFITYNPRNGRGNKTCGTERKEDEQKQIHGIIVDKSTVYEVMKVK